MAYDEALVQRVRSLLEGKPGFTEKKMFGGVCFLLRGNMACGILNEDLIVRVGPENYEDSLKLPNTREFDITGRSMEGWVMVSTEGHNTNESFSSWVERGIDSYTFTLRVHLSQC